MKELLLHVCCAPCSTYSIKAFAKKGFQITGFFFNPNIQPYKEFQKRVNTVQNYFRSQNTPLICNADYLLEDFLRSVPFQKPERCFACYRWRLERTAAEAKQKQMKFFSTTLLISPFQHHDALKKICREVQEKIGGEFIYKDLREGFKESTEISRREGLYRQNYCGCIFSEKERLLKSR